MASDRERLGHYRPNSAGRRRSNPLPPAAGRRVFPPPRRQTGRRAVPRYMRPTPGSAPPLPAAAGARRGRGARYPARRGDSPRALRIGRALPGGQRENAAAEDSCPGRLLPESRSIPPHAAHRSAASAAGFPGSADRDRALSSGWPPRPPQRLPPRRPPPRPISTARSAPPCVLVKFWPAAVPLPPPPPSRAWWR